MIAHFKEYFKTLTVQEYVESSSGWSDGTGIWNDLLTIEGYIRTLGGTERVSGDKDTLYSSHRLYTYLEDITTKHRIVDNANRIFNIKLVDKKPDFMQIDLEYVGVING